MNINTEIKMQKYNIILEKIKDKKGPNYLALQGTFGVYNFNEKLVTKLKPENRFYPISNI